MFGGSVHTLILDDPTATEALGRALAACLGAGSFVALRGDLGAGKTALARGVARGLGVEGPVPSPTYTLVARYEGLTAPLTHADWYRLSDVDELEQLGWDELVEGGGVVMVEWPDRVPSALPADRLDVSLRDLPQREGREARLQPTGPAHRARLAALTLDHPGIHRVPQ